MARQRFNEREHGTGFIGHRQYERGLIDTAATRAKSSQGGKPRAVRGIVFDTFGNRGETIERTGGLPCNGGKPRIICGHLRGVAIACHRQLGNTRKVAVKPALTLGQCLGMGYHLADLGLIAMLVQ